MSHNPNVRTIYGMSKEPSGFPNRTDSTVTFDDGSRTLSIAPASSSFEYYVQGVKYTHLSTATKQITDTEGLWHFYFDGYTLQATQTFTSSIITESAYVALVYWDAANNQAIYFGEERHGMTMDGSTHVYLHNVNGAVYVNGLGLGDFSIDGTGGISADGYFSVANGIIYDEDIIHTITDGSPQDLAPIASLPVFFREGTSGNWRRKTAEAFPVVYPGSVSGYDLSNTLLAYNDFNGTTWSLQEVTSGNYVLVHVLATNDKVHPAIAILGTNQYNNAVSARTGATTELATLSGLPFAELVPVGTVIFQTSNGFTNAIKGRIVSTDTGEDYVDFRNVSALPIGQINDHGNLSGLADADHPASAVYTSVAAFGGNLSSANTTVQSALDTLDDISIANKQLSNLSSTAINTSLLPDTDAVYDLGSVSSTWADGYFVSIYASSLDRSTAGAIAVGVATATSVTVGSLTANSVSLAAGTAALSLSAATSAVLIGPRLNANNIDCGSPGALAIGAVTATSVNVTPRLNVTAIDRASAGAITIGAVTTTSVAITPPTTIQSLNVGRGPGAQITNTVLGQTAGGATALTGTNLTCIGNGASPTAISATNQITLGNSSVTTLRCAVNTITLISDARDKADIQDISLGIDFLSTVRPVQFKWDRREWYSSPVLDDEGNVIGQTPGVSDGSKKQDKFEGGFIAQELDAAQTAANAEWMGLALKDNPDRLEATPLRLFPVVVKACQELHQKNQELEARLAALELLLEPLR